MVLVLAVVVVVVLVVVVLVLVLVVVVVVFGVGVGAGAGGLLARVNNAGTNLLKIAADARYRLYHLIGPDFKQGASKAVNMNEGEMVDMPPMRLSARKHALSLFVLTQFLVCAGNYGRCKDSCLSRM